MSHLPGFHSELVGLVGDAAFQAGTMHSNASWIAALGDGDTKRTLGYQRAVVADLHAMRA